METLFGIPVDVLMWAFLALLAAIIAWSIFVIVREPILFRLSARNIGRRVGRAFLIVIGLMLATAIISAAFGTGDTIAKTIRTEVITSLGNIDEIISAQEEGDIEVTGETSQLAYFDEAAFGEVRDAVADNEDVDGVMPLIFEGTGVQNLTTRQTEPRVTVFGADPAYMEGFGTIRDVDGGTLTMDDLASGELYVNPEARDDLDARPGNEIAVYGPGGEQTFIVKAVVDYDGGGTTSTEPGVMMRLSDAQTLFQREGQIKHIVISNRGDAESGADLTDQVMKDVQPVVNSLGLSIEPTKEEDLAEADEAGNTFSAFFVTFGSFSIAAGILLIFLIFVMLAGERKSEMGITRAVGGERRHLVEMFALEGLAYDLVAAAIGAALHRRRLGDGGGHQRRLRGAGGRAAPHDVDAKPDHRVCDGGGADLFRRDNLGVAREPPEHRRGDPQPAGGAEAGRARLARLGDRALRARRIADVGWPQ